MAAILITGSTDGLGRELARRLGANGSEVIVHGRDPAKVEDAQGEAGAAAGYVADFARLDDVRRLAGQVRSNHERLEVLVNNAGIAPPERRAFSEDGLELGFQVNYLAGFLLANELLPLLEQSAPARIVNVASIGQAPLDFDDVMLEQGYDVTRSYSQSKLAQVMHAFELAERLPADRLSANALHPATLMDTKLVRESVGRVLTTVDEGADATLRLIASSELDGVSGRYFDGQNEARANGQAYDPDARRRLWQLSEQLVGSA